MVLHLRRYFLKDMRAGWRRWKMRRQHDPIQRHQFHCQQHNITISRHKPDKTTYVSTHTSPPHIYRWIVLKEDRYTITSSLPTMNQPTQIERHREPSSLSSHCKKNGGTVDTLHCYAIVVQSVYPMDQVAMVTERQQAATINISIENIGTIVPGCCQFISVSFYRWASWGLTNGDQLSAYL